MTNITDDLFTSTHWISKCIASTFLFLFITSIIYVFNYLLDAILLLLCIIIIISIITELTNACFPPSRNVT